MLLKKKNHSVFWTWLNMAALCIQELTVAVASAHNQVSQHSCMDCTGVPEARP